MSYLLAFSFCFVTLYSCYVTVIGHSPLSWITYYFTILAFSNQVIHDPPSISLPSPFPLPLLFCTSSITIPISSLNPTIPLLTSHSTAIPPHLSFILISRPSPLFTPTHIRSPHPYLPPTLPLSLLNRNCGHPIWRNRLLRNGSCARLTGQTDVPRTVNRSN